MNNKIDYYKRIISYLMSCVSPFSWQIVDEISSLEYETRSVFANDKFLKLMQDVTRDKAEKDIWEVRLCFSQYIP